MRLRPEQLSNQLQNQPLQPVYLISGDEPLQMMEAVDAVRQTAKMQGFEERTVVEVTRNFDWNDLFREADTLSLFASKKLIECRLGTFKPGAKGGKALTEYSQRLPQDTILLITSAKIESASQKTKWFKALDSVGTIVQVWPVDGKSLPAWIQRRFSTRDRSVSLEAANYIADRVEGNMLAAAQEIEIICLISTKTQLELDDVMNVGDSSRYDVFKLVDAVLEGKPDRALKMLDGLRSEGLEPIIVHWALIRELRSLYRMATRLVANEPIDAVLNSQRVWQNRAPLVKAALQRHKPRGLQVLIKSAANLEHTLKGRPGDVWNELTWLCMRMAGVRLEQSLLRTLSIRNH